MKVYFNASSALSLACALLGSVTYASEIELRAPDGAMTIKGQLIKFDENKFRIKTNLGVLNVERSQVECFGAACPKEKSFNADLTIRGSDTIGDELMPLLIAGYANSLGAQTPEMKKIGADTVALSAKNTAGQTVLVSQVQAAGSSTGFKALIARQTDIAMSSRPARSKEIKAIASQGRGNIVDLSQEYIIAVDSILTVVSPENPIGELKMDQLASIFSGRITNWSQVGGPDLPITVFTRPETSGTRGVFEKAVLEPFALSMSDEAIVLGSNEEIAEQVEKSPGAIGYTGFAYQGETKSIDLVSSCGIRAKATAFNSKTEEYPLQRRLRLFTDNKALPPHARGLLNFAISQDADNYVRKAGFIDLSVKVDPSGIDANSVISAANQNDEKIGFETMGRLFSELERADRLSTMFRFVSGSSKLDNKSLRDLGRMVEFLKRPENQGREIIVAGFTDSVGAFGYNSDLSQNRAQTIKAALENEARKHGLSGLNMRAVGFSELAPVGCNTTEQGKERNRRVELWIR